MSFDGDNFNALIETSLKDRMFRLLSDAETQGLNSTTISLYRTTFEQLFRYPPQPLEMANAWHLVVVTLVGIRDRLIEVAREHHRNDVGERGGYSEFFEIEAKLDDEENEWRAAVGLPPIRSEHLQEE